MSKEEEATDAMGDSKLYLSGIEMQDARSQHMVYNISKLYLSGIEIALHPEPLQERHPLQIVP